MMVHKLLISPLLLSFPVFSGNDHGVVVSGGAAFNVEQACGNMDFTANQEKHYGKSEFIQHSGLAEAVGNLLSVFFNEEDFTWSIAPEDLKDIVLSNIHRVSGTKIYGSAIAFEPNVWSQTMGLEEGVPYPAASDACLSISDEFCEGGGSSGVNTNLIIDTLLRNEQNETIYCPYAYHGSPEEKAFADCSKETPEYCPSMDLAYAYDYSDTNNPAVEWYTAPRCLFFKEGVRTGYWTSPYFDAGAGNINMVTYSQPITKGDLFLGIATIDIEVSALCFGNQCENACPQEFYTYEVSDCKGSGGDRMVTYSTEDPSCPINPNAVDTLTCSYVPLSSMAGTIIYALGGLGALICLSVLVFMFVKRNTSLMKATQANISSGFVSGAFLANLSTFAQVGNYPGNCVISFWVAVLPVTMLLAFLFGKVYRTYVVFMGAKKFQRIEIADTTLLLRICFVMLIQIALLLVWTFVEDPREETRIMSESVDSRYCTGDYCFPMEPYCATNHGVMNMLPLLYLALMVVVGCVLSFQSREVPDCFSEAKYVMFAMYNFALNAGILLVVILAGGDELPVSVTTLLVSFAIFLTATGSVLLLFAPKIITMLTTPEHKIHENLKSVVRKSVFSVAPQTGSKSEGSQGPPRQSRVQFSRADDGEGGRASVMERGSRRETVDSWYNPAMDNEIDEAPSSESKSPVEQAHPPRGKREILNSWYQPNLDEDEEDEDHDNKAAKLPKYESKQVKNNDHKASNKDSTGMNRVYRIRPLNDSSEENTQGSASGPFNEKDHLEWFKRYSMRVQKNSISSTLDDSSN